MLQLPSETLADLDFRSALQRELARPPTSLPRQSLDLALIPRVDEAAEYLTGVFTQPLELAGADEIQAAKRDHAFRPLSILSLPERVLYEALSASIASDLPTVSREFEDWKTFTLAPLAVTDAEYVVSADIASFYLFIDHGRLQQQVVAQTGNSAVAMALSTLLHGVMQRRVGLPQLYRGSDVFIDTVERRLIREGWTVWRYNDDFRIVVSNWRRALRAIEALDRAARAEGLSLNDGKTYTLRMETYATRESASDAAWAEINEAVEFDFRRYDPYGGGPDIGSALLGAEEEEEEEETPDPALVGEAAARALEFWNDLEDDDSRGDRIPKQAYRQLLGQALVALTQIQSPAGLWAVHAILKVEPQLAAPVSRYMAAAASSDPDAVATTLEELVTDEWLYLNAWQRLWLLSAASSLGPTLPAEVEDWVRECLLEDQPGLLRSEAALILSAYGAIEAEEIIRIYGSVAPASRSDCIAALVNVEGRGTDRAKAVSNESPLNRWVAEWASGVSR